MTEFRMSSLPHGVFHSQKVILTSHVQIDCFSESLRVYDFILFKVDIISLSSANSYETMLKFIVQGNILKALPLKCYLKQ